MHWVGEDGGGLPVTDAYEPEVYEHPLRRAAGAGWPVERRASAW